MHKILCKAADSEPQDMVIVREVNDLVKNRSSGRIIRKGYPSIITMSHFLWHTVSNAGLRAFLRYFHHGEQGRIPLDISEL